MVATPAATPVATPVADPIVTVVASLLAQVPPEVASVSVTLDPIQTGAEPAIAAGDEFTVITCVVRQPVTGSV